MAILDYDPFRNTLVDLMDCYDHIWDTLGADEDEARTSLIELCLTIVEDTEGFAMPREKDEEDE